MNFGFNAFSYTLDMGSGSRVFSYRASAYKILISKRVSDNLSCIVTSALFAVHIRTVPADSGHSILENYLTMKFGSRKSIKTPLPGVVFLCAIILQALPTQICAAEPENISSVDGCRVIEDEKERLLCYDTVVNGGVFNEQKVRQVRVEEFGSERMPKEVKQEQEAAPASATSPSALAKTKSTKTRKVSNDELSVTIVRSKKDHNGFYYFQTEDGQVWKQQNASSWSGSVPYSAVIKKGLLGSYFLEDEGGRATRVKRVR